MRCHFIPIGVAVDKEKVTSVGENVEELGPCIAGGNVKHVFHSLLIYPKELNAGT